ncbi:MAG: LytTR family DNA-binding domain-containing protein, partial [Saprospiraceae bacterium]|nr:LytTR family DNA-binding domain-containing protein [Saprospiraceae bacterium]
MVKVNYDELLYVESFGEYVKLYTFDDVIIAYQRMTSMETMLPDNEFIRIHRSHIVNINRIKEIDKN